MSTASQHPTSTSPKRAASPVRDALAAGLLVAASTVMIGCPKTQFIDEGNGQPSSTRSGIAPPGSVGACKIRNAVRPPIVNPKLWRNLRYCTPKTPRRYLRLGYGAGFAKRPADRARMKDMMQALKDGAQMKDGNTRVIQTLRSIRRQAQNDERLVARVERSSGRTFACDYRYLLETTQKQYKKVSTGSECPVYAFDPKIKRDRCLFNPAVPEAKWLTSAWGCLAFTETVGEGQSCYRLCAYDDYCTAQTSCAAPDFDLALCAMGVCLPEKARGLF